MTNIAIKSCHDQYTVKVNEDCFSFHKSLEITQLVNILYPIIENTKNQQEKIQPELTNQYHNSIHQISMIQNMLKNLSLCEMEEQKAVVEEILHLATEWNYFLQDVFKAFDTEIPQ